jgi:hypothetical protein
MSATRANFPFERSGARRLFHDQTSTYIISVFHIVEELLPPNSFGIGQPRSIDQLEQTFCCGKMMSCDFLEISGASRSSLLLQRRRRSPCSWLFLLQASASRTSRSSSLEQEALRATRPVRCIKQRPGKLLSDFREIFVRCSLTRTSPRPSSPIDFRTCLNLHAETPTLWLALARKLVSKLLVAECRQGFHLTVLYLSNKLDHSLLASTEYFLSDRGDSARSHTWTDV